MTDHSIIACNSAHRWGAPEGCPGSAMLEATYPEVEERESAREGTAAAELAAAMILSESRAGIGYPYRSFQPSNGVVITDSIWESAKFYADVVAARMRETRNFNPKIEHRVYARRVHPTLSYGTLDCALIHPHNIIDLYDFKNGFVRVDAFENWQLINYAAGLLDELQINGIDEQRTIFCFHIVQPHYYKRSPVDTWSVKASDLRGYINILATNAAVALSDNPPLRAGAHCYCCNALTHCETGLNYGMKLFQQASQIGSRELPPQALGLQLKFIKSAISQLENLKTAYETIVESKVRSGIPVPGWGVKPKYGRDSWTLDYESRTAMADLMGVEIRKKETLTPKQAVAKGLDETLVKSVSKKFQTGVELAEDDTSLARKIFTYE